jgi:uncharacterized membrane-anchored protein YhcB (DUF1043 family)
MLNFTLLEPEVIAQFWIYMIGFFIVGLIVGWFVRHILTKTASENFRSEKERFHSEKEDFKTGKTELLKIKEQYEALCKDVEKSKEYWLYKQETKHEYTGNDPSELLHKGLKI